MAMIKAAAKAEFEVSLETSTTCGEAEALITSDIGMRVPAIVTISSRRSKRWREMFVE
jgi:hypothetical protein